MMGTEMFKIYASWEEKLTKTRVSFLMNPSVYYEFSFINMVSPLKNRISLPVSSAFKKKNIDVKIKKL